MQWNRTGRRLALTLAASAMALLLQACGGGSATTATTASVRTCDDGLKTSFQPDADTTVLLVKSFKAGDTVQLSGTPTQPAPVAPVDLCLVKLLVGPGHPETAGAPSTSAGIGIEVWLPTGANWNERIRAYGSGGWAGSAQTDLTLIGGGGDGNDLHVAAAGQGYVVATSDHGHASALGPLAALDASFGLNPDGTINTTLWRDFAERSLHEMAVKSKALARHYYGKAHKYAYWEGYSTGGRQGLKLAQVHPDDFDGIVAGAPAINWSRFITNELYPQVAMRQELGGPIASAKLTAVTNAAIASCGGATLGFLIDPYACRYDPTRDAAALCSGVSGNGGVVGTNADAASCVTLAEAGVVNRIWYGQTADGSVPDPALDNAAGPFLASSNQLWFGLTRGTDLGALAGATGPFPIAADQVAIELQNPALGSVFFRNAISNGTNAWVNLGYSGLTLAAYQGLALQSQFSDINTDDADLSAFKARGGKLLMFHGLADNLIASQGSDNYYNRVASLQGGFTPTQSFFRYYHVPGFAHTGRLEAGPGVPVPQSARGRDEMFTALKAWVEQGTAPGTITVTSSNNLVSLPLCVYPKKITYSGSGAVTAAGSYTCQ
jgi:feruloyl esterase